MSPSEAGVRISSLEPQKNGNQNSLRSCLFALFAWLAPLSALPAEGEPDLIPRCGGPFMLCGYVDKVTREERTPQRFEVARPFSDGLAAVRVKGLYGFIDTSGKFVIAPRFQNAGPFAGEYAEVRLDGATGIVNRAGEIVVAPQFKRIVPFVGDVFIVKPFGDVANYPREILRSDERLEGIPRAMDWSYDNGWGLYHLKKIWITELDLKFSPFDKSERGLIWASPKNKAGTRWGLMRSDGSWQVGLSYDQVSELKGGLAVVESKGFWGAVDQGGRLSVPLEFRSAKAVRDAHGTAMDTKTVKADPIIQQQVPPPRQPSPICPGGLRFFQKDELWGLQDSDGKTVIQPKYPALSCFRSGVTWVAQLNPTQWCPIGPDGKRIESMECKTEYYPHTWSHSRPENLASGQYDVSIAWNRAWLDYLVGKRAKAPEWVTMGYGYVRDSPMSK